MNSEGYINYYFEKIGKDHFFYELFMYFLDNYLIEKNTATNYFEHGILLSNNNKMCETFIGCNKKFACLYRLPFNEDTHEFIINLANKNCYNYRLVVEFVQYDNDGENRFGVNYEFDIKE